MQAHMESADIFHISEADLKMQNALCVQKSFMHNDQPISRALYDSEEILFFFPALESIAKNFFNTLIFTWSIFLTVGHSYLVLLVAEIW